MGSFPWEIDFMTALQSAAGKVWTPLMKGVSILGEETVMVMVIGLIYWCLNKEMGQKMALAWAVRVFKRDWLSNMMGDG